MQVYKFAYNNLIFILCIDIAYPDILHNFYRLFDMPVPVTTSDSSPVITEMYSPDLSQQSPPASPVTVLDLEDSLVQQIPSTTKQTPPLSTPVQPPIVTPTVTPPPSPIVHDFILSAYDQAPTPTQAGTPPPLPTAFNSLKHATPRKKLSTAFSNSAFSTPTFMDKAGNVSHNYYAFGTLPTPVHEDPLERLIPAPKITPPSSPSDDTPTTKTPSPPKRGRPSKKVKQTPDSSIKTGFLATGT